MDKDKKLLVKSININGVHIMKLGSHYWKMTPVESGHVTNPATELERLNFEDAVNFMIDSLNDKINSLESKIKALETMVFTLMDKDDNDDTPLDYLSTPENP